jgi:hypothetical protein
MKRGETGADVITANPAGVISPVSVVASNPRNRLRRVFALAHLSHAADLLNAGMESMWARKRKTQG